jgi:hypothetical protein
LRNALSNAEREEFITRNVAKLVQIPTPRYEVGKGLPVSDVKRLLSAGQGTRFYPVYVLGLRWSDIDFATNLLQVAQTVQRVSGRLITDETKTDASDAVIPQPKITRAGAARTPGAPAQDGRRCWRVVDRPRSGFHHQHRHTHRAPKS